MSDEKNPAPLPTSGGRFERDPASGALKELPPEADETAAAVADTPAAKPKKPKEA